MKYIFYGFLLGLPMLCAAGKKKIELANVMEAEVEKEVQEIDFADLEEFYVYNIQGNSGDMQWLKPFNHTFSALETLRLSGCGLGNKGIHYLSKMRAKNLETLDLSDNHVDNSGLVHLTKSAFDHLTVLLLNSNTITGEGVTILLKGKWSDLRYLNLLYNKINYQGARDFVNSEFQNLTVLRFRVSPIETEVYKVYEFFKSKSTNDISFLK